MKQKREASVSTVARKINDTNTRKEFVCVNMNNNNMGPTKIQNKLRTDQVCSPAFFGGDHQTPRPRVNASFVRFCWLREFFYFS